MKTLKVSDDVHQKLTSLLGELMAETSKMQTYQDAIEAMLNQSVILPPELLAEIEDFIENNKRLGYTTREEFLRDAARWRLSWLRDEYEYLEIPKEKFEKLDKAVRALVLPASDASEFIHGAIDDVLQEYEEHIEERE